MKNSKLKWMRVSKLMTQAILEEESGVSQVTICHAERGQTNPSDLTKQRLANALGCKVSDIFPINDKDETNDKIEKQ